MAMRGYGKRSISHALSGEYSGAACLLNFRCGNVKGKRVSDQWEVETGKLPQEWRDRMRKDMERAGCLYVVWSYKTPIAWCTMPHPSKADQRHEWTVPDVKYSPTTTNHQNVVRVEIEHPGFYRDTKW